MLSVMGIQKRVDAAITHICIPMENVIYLCVSIKKKDKFDTFIMREDSGKVIGNCWFETLVDSFDVFFDIH